MKKRSKFKAIVITFVIIFVLFLVGLCLFVFPIGLKIDGIDAACNLQLSLPAQDTGSICASANGAVYTLTDLGLLKEITKTGTNIVSTSVYQMLPTQRGVAYTIGEDLYYAEAGESSLISEDVSTFTCYGDKIIYFSKSALFAWNDEETELLIELPDTNVFALVASETHIAIVTSSKILHYHANETIEELDLSIGSSQQYFLYRDWLVIVGEGENGAIAYHLETKKLYSVDIGWYACEHFNKITVTCDEESIYLSVHSKIWPQFEEQIHTATLHIDPQTWKTTKLNAHFYDGLVIAKDALYGAELSFFSGQWALIS